MDERYCPRCGRTIGPHTEACQCGCLVNQPYSSAKDRATDPALFMVGVAEDLTPGGLVGGVVARVAVGVMETVVPGSWKAPLGVLALVGVILWLVVKVSLYHPLF